MGRPDDESAVVNTHGCVLGGVSGLRIIDASIMPVLPPGQPMSTVCKCSKLHYIQVHYSPSHQSPFTDRPIFHLDAIAEKLSHDILKGHHCLN